MLQLRHEIGPRTDTAVSPHIVVRSTLLELGYADLSRRIAEELQENPALDVELDGDNYADMPVGPPPTPVFSGSSASSSDEGLPMDAVAASQSLGDELLWQFHATAPKSLHEIGEVVIAAIDDDGYLNADIFAVARDLEVDYQQVQRALEYVQQLSPSGIGARSLAECLKLQLRARREDGHPVPEEVSRVVEHFASCCKRDIEQELARSTYLTVEQIRDALEYIRCHLHPYPGRQFHPQTLPSQVTEHIYPDAIIYYDGQQLCVKIPQSQARTLRISGAYLRLEHAIRRGQTLEGVQSSSTELGAEQVQNLRDQIRCARRFIRMLQQRRITMRRVTETILRHQKALFTQGVMALKPLTKKQIAQETGLHESTVSRATRGKYVMVPSGALLPFSVFFEDALPVKAFIARIIQDEDPDAPFTDRQLEELLTEQGYDLARRTITKYRKQMDIPSSRSRDGSFRLQPAQLLA